MNKGLLLFAWVLAAAAQRVEAPAGIIQDKIRGGLLGQILGDLNGLKHEMKYIAEPGNVEEYTPGLPEGAWTDDDTDVEWVYVLEMERTGATLLAPGRITELWKKHINSRIWCSNQYLRQLMDLGIEPPLTGQIQFNPWSDFNLSGQFLSETFGLIAPGMPQTAARIGLNYTRVGIDGEPAQATQLFTSMIATAFLTQDINEILEAGLAALDRTSRLRQIVADVRRWHRENPNDWRTTRRLLKQNYSLYNGEMQDRNGYALNAGSVIGALLYGQGDFVRTARHAFNFGWDCDNNAATAGTIVGVIKGNRWMMEQGWSIQDRFRNTSRDGMPADETITRFGDRLIRIAERVISEHGGEKTATVYRIRREKPGNVAPLANVERQSAELRSRLKAEIESGIAGATEQQARAAYLAICLDLAQGLRAKHPEQWARALAALNGYPKVVQVLFFQSPMPAGDKLRARAVAAGLEKPAKQEKIW